MCPFAKSFPRNITIRSQPQRELFYTKREANVPLFVSSRCLVSVKLGWQKHMPLPPCLRTCSEGITKLICGIFFDSEILLNTWTRHETTFLWNFWVGVFKIERHNRVSSSEMFPSPLSIYSLCVLDLVVSLLSFLGNNKLCNKFLENLSDFFVGTYQDWRRNSKDIGRKNY